MRHKYFFVGVLVFLSISNSSQKNLTNVKGLAERAGFVPDGFEEVTEKPSEGYGAIDKCGEGASKGLDMCVPYYQCDSETRTIIQDARTDGFGIIDIRFGDDKPCDHYLDICCKIPPNWSSTSSPDIEPPPDPSESPIDDRTPGYKPTEKPKPGPKWTCGIRNDNGVDFKITGNSDHEAEYGEFPWMAAIVKTHYNPPNDNLLICGGSLIAPNVVLTAAHCVYKLDIDDMKVRLGEWDTQTEKERLPYQERNVQKVIVHEGFNSQVLFNDVALLILDYPVEEAEHIGTICLPQQNMVFTSNECIATGWGKDKFGFEGNYQAILKKIRLPVVPQGECQEILRTTRLGKFFVLDKSFMCAGGRKGEDTCSGDGGSPLVCPDPNNPHTYVQAGIVAWGIGCGDRIPAVYADVASFSSWINEKLNSL